MGQAENSVSYAVEQICNLYGVQVTREQSRQFNVQGAAGRWRPMFFGAWTDDEGVKHNSGKPDFLARPRIFVYHSETHNTDEYMSVPLWIECKAKDKRGKMGKQSPHQAAFQRWVEKNGETYLLLLEDARPLLKWFDEHGVRKNCDDVAIANVITPMDADELYVLPCKHCGFSRAFHIGKIFACDMRLAGCSTKLIGKVWSPDLRKGARPREKPE